VEELRDRSIVGTGLSTLRGPHRADATPIGVDLEIFEIFWTRGRALSEERSGPIRLDVRRREVRMLLNRARDGADHLGSKYLGIGSDICGSPKWENR
jgi:hypothetical protein